MTAQGASRKTSGEGWVVLAGLTCMVWILGAFFENLLIRAFRYPVSMGGPANLRGTLLSSIGAWSVLILATPFTMWLLYGADFKPGRRWRSALTYLLVFVGLAIVRGVLMSAWDYFVVRQNPLGEFRILVQSATDLAILATRQLRGSIKDLAAIAAAVNGWRYYNGFRERARAAAALELERAQLRGALSEARLSALQAQLQPHFLFNALNTVSALILSRKLEAADDTIAELGAFLRMTLDTSDAPTVPLAVELQFLDAYLHIQKARFEDRLQVRMEVEERARSARVPRLMLQPLAENAIRHGIGTESGTGVIVVRAAVEDGRLHLEMQDSGRGLGSGDPGGGGIGLKNLRERLEQLYPGAHELVLRDVPSGGAIATITIPFQPAGPQSDGS
jgi:hypothetical protein